MSGTVNRGDFAPSSIKRHLSQGRRSVRRKLRPHGFKETYATKGLQRPGTGVYLEIGVRFGNSFRAAPADRKLAVDPVRTTAFSRLRSGEEFYQMTSDDFFANHAQTVLADTKIQVAMVDGLHTFEQTYKDIFNLRPLMASDGLIVIDDCNPTTADRGRPEPVPGLWNGDVWKLFVALADVIPEQHLFTIDADQGIGLIASFAESWPDPSAAELGKIAELPYEYLSENRQEILRLRAPGPLI